MGALPKGHTHDDPLTFPEQAAKWLNQTVDWTWKHRDTLPGVIKESREVRIFIPSAYLDSRLPIRRNKK